VHRNTFVRVLCLYPMSLISNKYMN